MLDVSHTYVSFSRFTSVLSFSGVGYVGFTSRLLLIIASLSFPSCWFSRLSFRRFSCWADYWRWWSAFIAVQCQLVQLVCKGLLGLINCVNLNKQGKERYRSVDRSKGTWDLKVVYLGLWGAEACWSPRTGNTVYCIATVVASSTVSSDTVRYRTWDLLTSLRTKKRRWQTSVPRKWLRPISSVQLINTIVFGPSLDFCLRLHPLRWKNTPIERSGSWSMSSDYNYQLYMSRNYCIVLYWTVLLSGSDDVSLESFYVRFTTRNWN